jgi:hypothetical protein
MDCRLLSTYRRSLLPARIEDILTVGTCAITEASPVFQVGQDKMKPRTALGTPFKMGVSLREHRLQ